MISRLYIGRSGSNFGSIIRTAASLPAKDSATPSTASTFAAITAFRVNILPIASSLPTKKGHDNRRSGHAWPLLVPLPIRDELDGLSLQQVFEKLFHPRYEFEDLNQDL